MFSFILGHFLRVLAVFEAFLALFERFLPFPGIFRAVSRQL